MQKSVLNSPRLLKIKKEKHKILYKKILFLTLFLATIFIGLAFLSRWGEFNISNIEITGNKVIETEAIKNIVKDKTFGYYFYFFPKSNFLLYPKGEIINELTLRFKRLKNISLNTSNSKTLNVSLVERTALYTYCGEQLEEKMDTNTKETNSNDEKCYFMDESGYVFDEAPYFSGEVYLKFYGKTNIPYFTKLISFKNTLEKIGVKPAIFNILDNGDIEIYLSSSLKSQMGPKIIFKADSDFEQVLENLQSVLTTEPLQTDFKNKYSSLLYIDLRFGNKVYYKFK